MAIDGVPAGIDVILFAGLLLPDAKEFNAGNLQAGPGVLPDKALTGGAAQAIRQYLGLAQAGSHQPPGLAVNFATFPDGADPRQRGGHLAVNHDPPLTQHAALRRQTAVRLHAGGQHHSGSTESAPVRQPHAILFDGGDPAFQHTADAARFKLLPELIGGKSVGQRRH